MKTTQHAPKTFETKGIRKEADSEKKASEGEIGEQKTAKPSVKKT